MGNRWWIYQQERFPLLTHGPLIGTLSFSALSFSMLSRGQATLPETGVALFAFVSTFLFFLQLRIADEFKDYEEDALYRPYRPVPRGLVTLRELGIMGAASAVIQSALTFKLAPGLLPLLALVWVYMALMGKEFFVGQWLKAHPIIYMWSHLMILPLIFLYASAFDWLVAGDSPPEGLFWFLAVGFFNGMVFEIGRKIRTADNEERGVETYSALWGGRNAVLAWLGAMVLTAAAALLAAKRIDWVAPLAGLLSALIATAAMIAWRFLRRPVTRQGGLIELMSGLWTLIMYSGLGAAPLLWRL